MNTQALLTAVLFLGFLCLCEVAGYTAILAFILGIIFTLVLVVVGVMVGLQTAETAVRKAKDKELAKKTDFPAIEEAVDVNVQHQGFIQILPKGTTAKTPTWVWGILKANMLLFKDMKDERKTKGVVRLDGCTVTPTKMKVGALWKRSNYVRIKHADRVVLPPDNECVLFFRTGREMEEWYHALHKASILTTKPELAAAEQRTRAFFRELIQKLGLYHSKDPVDAVWLNALSHRIFYHLHNDPGLNHKYHEKIQHKIDKVKKPSMVKSIKVLDLTFGTNLPLADNVQIVSMSPDGEIKLDADITYAGGFQLTIEVTVEIEAFGSKYGTSATLKVTVKKLSGKVRVQIAPPPADRLWIGFYREPDIEFDIDSTIGTSSKVANIPKVASIIVYKLKQEIIEIMVLPDMDDFAFPDVKPPPGQGKSKVIPWEYRPGYQVPEGEKNAPPVVPAATSPTLSTTATQVHTITSSEKNSASIPTATAPTGVPSLPPRSPAPALPSTPPPALPNRSHSPQTQLKQSAPTQAAGGHVEVSQQQLPQSPVGGRPRRASAPSQPQALEGMELREISPVSSSPQSHSNSLTNLPDWTMVTDGPLAAPPPQQYSGHPSNTNPFMRGSQSGSQTERWSSSSASRTNPFGNAPPSFEDPLASHSTSPLAQPTRGQPMTVRQSTSSGHHQSKVSTSASGSASTSPPEKPDKSLFSFKAGGLRDRLTKKLDKSLGTNLNQMLREPSAQELSTNATSQSTATASGGPAMVQRIVSSPPPLADFQMRDIGPRDSLHAHVHQTSSAPPTSTTSPPNQGPYQLQEMDSNSYSNVKKKPSISSRLKGALSDFLDGGSDESDSDEE